MAALISIGVPVYNGGLYLGEALDSICNQTITDLEIVVVDNASTDDSYAIALEFAERDDRIRVIRNTTNLGAAGNFNRAFEECSGTYFKWAAHDDRLEPTFLERCLDVMEVDPGVSVAYPVTVDVDEADQELFTTRAGDYAGSQRAIDRATDIVLRPSPCYESFGLFRRSTLAETGLIGAFTSSDRVMLLELALRGRFVEIDEPLFRRRRHTTNSVTSNPDDRARKAWFDPSATGRSYPVWRLGQEYRRAAHQILNYPDEGWRFDVVLARWALHRRRRLVREALDAGLGQGLQVFRSLRRSTPLASTGGIR